MKLVVSLMAALSFLSAGGNFIKPVSDVVSIFKPEPQFMVYGGGVLGECPCSGDLATNYVVGVEYKYFGIEYQGNDVFYTYLTAMAEGSRGLEYYVKAGVAAGSACSGTEALGSVGARYKVIYGEVNTAGQAVLGVFKRF